MANHYGPCSRCGKEDSEPQYSLGIYAGRWCESCWASSGYRKEGAEGFSPDDAGESYEEEDESIPGSQWDEVDKF